MKGFIKSLFNTEEPVTAKFYARTDTVTDGVRDFTEALSLTVQALFWEGSTADRVVSDRLRAEIDGVLAIDYEDYTVTVADKDRVTIDDVNYSVVHPDNVARQNVAMIVPVKRSN